MASIAVPTLRVSQDVLDFGTCLVGQSVEMHVTLYNPSQSASAWIAEKGNKNDGQRGGGYIKLCSSSVIRRSRTLAYLF